MNANVVNLSLLPKPDRSHLVDSDYATLAGLMIRSRQRDPQLIIYRFVPCNVPDIPPSTSALLGRGSRKRRPLQPPDFLCRNRRFSAWAVW